MTTDITELAQKRNAAISRLSRAFEPGHSSQSELDALSYAVDVMNELVEALEKAQAKATQQGNIACALFDEVTQLRRHADEKAPELRAQLIEADSELEALRQRIAELEAQVKFPGVMRCNTCGFSRSHVIVTPGGMLAGESAIAGEIEIAMKAIGVPVTWANGDAEKRMTGADWLTAIELYKPHVRIVEENIPRAAGIKWEAE